MILDYINCPIKIIVLTFTVALNYQGKLLLMTFYEVAKRFNQYHSWFSFKPPPDNFEMLKYLEKENLLKT